MTVEFLSVGILSKESDMGKNVNCFAHLPVPPQAMHDKQSCHLGNEWKQMKDGCCSKVIHSSWYSCVLWITAILSELMFKVRPVRRGQGME